MVEMQTSRTQEHYAFCLRHRRGKRRNGVPLAAVAARTDSKAEQGILAGASCGVHSWWASVSTHPSPFLLAMPQDGRRRTPGFYYPQRLWVAFALSLLLCAFAFMLVLSTTAKVNDLVDDAWEHVSTVREQAVVKVQEVVVQAVLNVQDQYAQELQVCHAVRTAPRGHRIN